MDRQAIINPIGSRRRRSLTLPAVVIPVAAVVRLLTELSRVPLREFCYGSRGLVHRFRRGRVGFVDESTGDAFDLFLHLGDLLLGVVAAGLGALQLVLDACLAGLGERLLVLP